MDRNPFLPPAYLGSGKCLRSRPVRAQLRTGTGKALVYKLIGGRSYAGRARSDGLSGRGGSIALFHGLGSRVHTLEAGLVEGGVVTNKPTSARSKLAASSGHSGCFGRSEMGGGVRFCSRDRTAEWPQPARQRPLGGAAIGWFVWSKIPHLCKNCAVVRDWKGGLLVLCENGAKSGNLGWFRLVWIGVFYWPLW